MRPPAGRAIWAIIGLLALIGVLVVLAPRLRPRRDARLVFSYTTFNARFWQGDCNCPAPVVMGTTLVFCGGSNWKNEERLIAVDLRTSKELWRRGQTNGCGMLRVIDDVLYHWDGRALSAYSAAGALLWRRADVYGLPFVTAGRLYLSASATPTLMVLDPEDWSLLEEIPLPDRPDRTPIADGPILRYGTRSGYLVSLDLTDRKVTLLRPATRILSPLVQQGALLVFNAEVDDGFALIGYDLQRSAVRWSVNTHTLSQATPLIEGEWVYFGADRLYAVRLTDGDTRSYDLGGGPVGSAVRYGDVLYVPGGNSLHALDPATGEVHWRFDAGKWVNAPSTIGPPPIVNDVMYVGSLDCRVYGVRTGR